MTDRLFCVCALQHLIFAEAIARELGGEGRKILIVWTLPGNASLHQNILKTATEGFWDEVVAPERVNELERFQTAHGLLSVIGNIVDFRRLNRHFSKILDNYLPLAEVFICSEYSLFDRWIYRWAHSRNLSVNFIEDGMTSYLRWHYNMNGVAVRGGWGWKNLMLGRKFFLLFLGRDQFVFRNKVSAIFARSYFVFPEKITKQGSDASRFGLVCPINIRSSLSNMPEKERGISWPATLKKAVLLSQSLTEDGMVSVDTYREMLSRLLDVLRGAGYCTAVKFHPRDAAWKRGVLRNLEGDNVILLPDSAPAAEILLASESGVLLLGFWSSTLFYMPRLYGMTSLSLLPLLVESALKRGEAVSALESSLFEFRGRFSEDAIWIDSWDEFSKAL